MNTAEPPIAAGPSPPPSRCQSPAQGPRSCWNPTRSRAAAPKADREAPSSAPPSEAPPWAPILSQRASARDILIPEVQLYYPVFVTDELSFVARKRWEELPESTGRESQLGLRSLPHVFISPSFFLLPPPSLPFALCFSPPHSSLSHG